MTPSAPPFPHGLNHPSRVCRHRQRAIQHQITLRFYALIDGDVDLAHALEQIGVEIGADPLQAVVRLLHGLAVVIEVETGRIAQALGDGFDGGRLAGAGDAADGDGEGRSSGRYQGNLQYALLKP